MLSFRHREEREYATQRERRRWARSIEHVARDAERPIDGLLVRSPSPLYDPRVIRACAPALAQIRHALRDETADVSSAALAALETFLCDGASSPLFGDDPAAAQQSALELRKAFLEPD